MILYYDSTTGAIQSAISAASDPQTYPANPGTPLYVDDATYPTLRRHLDWYCVQDGVPVAQPAWSVSAAAGTTSGQWTVTATLHNPPSTPPTSATFTVAGTTFTETVTSGQATLTLAIHPTLGNQRVTVTVSASGTASGSTAIGTDAPLIGQQIVTLSGIPTVSPGGPGSLDYVLQAQASTVDPAQQINSLAVAVGEILHVLHAKVLPALQASAYTPITLSADETTALDDLTTNVLPAIVPRLATLYPSGGSPMPIYAQMKAALATIQAAMDATNTALTELPGLE